jgi:hypothetical protein
MKRRSFLPAFLPAMLAALSAAVAAALLVACSSTPQPEWKANAKDALDRASAAYLQGDTRTATQEFRFARAEVARTGRADLLARVVLTECAVHIASLDLDDCSDFDKLRQDASDVERAYADYLSGQLTAAAIALLPSRHRAVAQAQSDGAAASALQKIDDPIAQLVAAGVLLRTHRASPPVLALAAETASAQGWQRPLLAWLGAQKQLAQQRGEQSQLQSLQRRIELIQNAGRPPRGQDTGKH